MNLTQILENSSTLFSHVLIPRRSAPTKIKPIYPDKLKFIVKPDTVQVLHSGLYVEIPELMFSEMEILEKAILKVIPDISKPLNIPSSLGLKLGQASSSILNGFIHKSGKTFLESANCLFVCPRAPLTPTDLNDPSYGTLLPLNETACCLSYLLASISLYKGGNYDSLPLMLDKTWKKVKATSGVNMTKARFQKGEFKIGLDTYYSSIEDDCITPGLSHLLGSFLYLEKDITEFLEW